MGSEREDDNSVCLPKGPPLKSSADVSSALPMR